MMVSGCYPTNTDNYVFAQKESVLKISRKSKDNCLVVQGFIPEKFVNEIHHLRVMINNESVANYEVSDFVIDLNIMLETTSSIFPENHFVKLVFDGEHVPDDSEADHRNLACALTYIGMEYKEM